MSGRGMPSPGFIWHKLPSVKFKDGIVKIQNGRRPGREPVEYKLRFLPYLSDQVSEKGEKTSDVFCIQEMAIMLACFKKHDFQDEFCPKEVANFRKCFDLSLADYKKKEAQKSEGAMVETGKNKYPPSALNKFLKQFPRQGYPY